MMVRKKTIPLLFLTSVLLGRSVHRPEKSEIPTITTYWHNHPQKYRLQDWRLEESALFKTFDKKFFDQHQLPRGPISLRNNGSEHVLGKQLDEHLNVFIKELFAINDKQDSYSTVTVIKNKDYNYKTQSGVIIVSFKKYPFVAKIFIENPKSLVHPFSKGFEPICFYIMGGGINRYLSGFTRVKNRDEILAHIQQDPAWHKRVTVPRKWFWTPTDVQWFVLEGLNIGGKHKRNSATLPSIYAVIADEIKNDGSLKLRSKEHRSLGMELSDFLGNRVDPNITNFVLEKGTDTVVLVDTEHFPTMVGLREKTVYTSYPDWYLKLITKCVHDGYFRTKKERLACAHGKSTPIMSV